MSIDSTHTHTHTHTKVHTRIKLSDDIFSKEVTKKMMFGTIFLQILFYFKMVPISAKIFSHGPYECQILDPNYMVCFNIARKIAIKLFL